MFWCLSFLSLLLLENTYGDVSKTRVRHQDLPQNDQLIDNIFNIPITAIRQTADVAQVFSPNNTQAIDSVFKIPISTLEAVSTLVKSTAEQRQQNIQKNRQERRDQLLARKKQKWEEVQNQQASQQQAKRVIRHHKDPLKLNVLSDLLVGHHSLASGHHGHFSGYHGGLLGHGGHKHRKGHHFHNVHGNRPQNTYEVHEDVNEDTSFSWHGLITGFGSLHGTRPSSSSTSIKIENKVAPKGYKEKISKYSNDDVNFYNKVAERDRTESGDNYPPLENKIAPRTGRVIFV